jgi:hypothetical protein
LARIYCPFSPGWSHQPGLKGRGVSGARARTAHHPLVPVGGSNRDLAFFSDRRAQESPADEHCGWPENPPAPPSPTPHRAPPPPSTAAPVPTPPPGRLAERRAPPAAHRAPPERPAPPPAHTCPRRRPPTPARTEHRRPDASPSSTAPGQLHHRKVIFFNFRLEK